MMGILPPPGPAAWKGTKNFNNYSFAFKKDYAIKKGQKMVAETFVWNRLADTNTNADGFRFQILFTPRK